MTTEFRIDKPGVYVNRCGELRMVIPIGLPDKWCVTLPGSPLYVRSDGRVSYGHRDDDDVIAYVRPLPADVLQRMAEALAAAEYQPQQTAPMTFGEALKAMAKEPKQ
jgi:hypothetical protein